MSELAAALVTTDGPFPTAPPFGLTAVAQEAPDAEHWEAGSHVLPYPSAEVQGQDPCLDGTFRQKVVPDGIDWHSFPTFTAYLGDICTASGIGDWGTWKARANAALAARLSWALEAQLVDARFSEALALIDGTALLAGAAVSPATAVAALEGAVADTGVEGVLHLTPEVVSYLGATFFVRDGSILRTASGTPVVVGRGYSDMAGLVAEDGQSWVYATGPVLYRQDRLITNMPDTVAEALDRGDNTVIYRAEADLWVGWDGVLNARALADWTPS